MRDLVRRRSLVISRFDAPSLTFGAIVALVLPSAPAHGAPRADSVLDEVRLRDGTHLRGRVIEKEPGRWIVVETEDGHHRTFAWDVVEEVNLVSGLREPWIPQPIRAAWLGRGGWDVSYEIRAELTAVVLPNKTFTLAGVCATGTGIAPAAMYGRTVTDRGYGFGGGLGGRASYMYLSPLEPASSSSWWSLRVGAGLDLALLYSRAPTGVPEANGELCSQVARSSREVASASRPVLLTRIPFTVGGHLGLGKLADVLVWRGVALGAAWSPSYVHVGSWTGSGSGSFHPLGLELTLDFTTLHAVPATRRPEAHSRLALFIAAPSKDGPSVWTLSFGAVWY